MSGFIKGPFIFARIGVPQKKKINKEKDGDKLNTPTQSRPRVLPSRRSITRFTIEKHRVDWLPSSAAAAAVVAVVLVAVVVVVVVVAISRVKLSAAFSACFPPRMTPPQVLMDSLLAPGGLQRAVLAL